MKQPLIRIYFLLLSVIFIALISNCSTANAQAYKYNKHWYIGPHAGAASFFGDLSIYDFDPVKKLTKESDFAYGILVGKGINHFLDIQLSWTKGKMKGSNPELDMYFNNSFSEISIGPELILSELIWPGHRSHFNLNLKAAAGLIKYRSIKYRLSDDTFLSSEGFTPLHENSGSARTSMVFSSGVGLSYHINKHWALRGDFSIRLQNKDLLDVHIGSTDVSDRYSYTSFGFVYVFSPTDKQGIRDLECPGDYRPVKKRKSKKNNKFTF